MITKDEIYQNSGENIHVNTGTKEKVQSSVCGCPSHLRTYRQERVPYFVVSLTTLLKHTRDKNSHMKKHCQVILANFLNIF